MRAAARRVARCPSPIVLVLCPNQVSGASFAVPVQSRVYLGFVDVSASPLPLCVLWLRVSSRVCVCVRLR